MAKPKISNSQGNCPDAFRYGGMIVFRDTKDSHPDSFHLFSPDEWAALKHAFSTGEYDLENLEVRQHTNHVEQP